MLMLFYKSIQKGVIRHHFNPEIFEFYAAILASYQVDINKLDIL